MKKDEVFNVEMGGFELLDLGRGNYGLKFRVKGKSGFGVVRLSREELSVVAVSALHHLLGVRMTPQV